MAAAEFAELARRGGQEFLRLFAVFARQHQQELAPAARTKQDARQPELGQQRARQGLAQQSNPLGAAGEKLLAVRPGGHRPAGRGQKELLYAQDFSLQKDLFGHLEDRS